MNTKTFQALAAQSVITTDVLVLGGGPAGTWAALSAAKQGARVVLADKGYCGTSGATAPSNTGAWYLPKGAERDAEIERRLSRSSGLADRRWLQRVIEQAQIGLDDLGDNGYPFPFDEQGNPYRANLRGPDYMRFMRQRAGAAGVHILDHHPALELLWADGAIAGATGIHPRSGNRWEVRAGAVVLATGGCAFLSHALGCDGNTGDGYLMAAEAGVRLSGMEFSSQYGLSPAHTSVTKGLTFTFASFYLEDGSPLPETGEDRAVRIARQLLAGEKVYALMNRGNPIEHEWLRQGQPNCFLPFERIGLDPFQQPFPVTLRSEGTVRGVGGLEIINNDCATKVPGLYAAGDAASRENLTGAVSGGGSPNASWAIASGTWSGRAAALFAASLGEKAETRLVRGLGQAGLRPRKQPLEDELISEAISAVQAETLPLDVNFFRSGARIALSRQRLDAVWADISDYLVGEGRNALRAREAAAMAATARWIWASADARKESRGMHRRTDFTKTDVQQTRRIFTSGIDNVVVVAAENQLQEVA
ncbi:FAD-binding protein [Nostoc sp. LEGE 12447]|uniref:FAD-dependent oxidoreductase n=1 Tax=Nostoc sp. LEGE 12447 TaxID=1828640 RepID=UPI0018848A1F|nr:FAD-binding protein [Nostoc sp. LEGE 12447]MBE9003155.1 FAD-binding protein [Nostoc sp. LEGE 12447]